MNALGVVLDLHYGIVQVIWITELAMYKKIKKGVKILDSLLWLVLSFFNSGGNLVFFLIQRGRQKQKKTILLKAFYSSKKLLCSHAIQWKNNGDTAKVTCFCYSVF